MGVEGGGCSDRLGLAHCWALRHQAQSPEKALTGSGWWGWVVWLVGFLVFDLLIVDASIRPHVIASVPASYGGLGCRWDLGVGDVL